MRCGVPAAIARSPRSLHDVDDVNVWDCVMRDHIVVNGRESSSSSSRVSAAAASTDAGQCAAVSAAAIARSPRSLHDVDDVNVWDCVMRDHIVVLVKCLFCRAGAGRYLCARHSFPVRWLTEAGWNTDVSRSARRGNRFLLKSSSGDAIVVVVFRTDASGGRLVTVHQYEGATTFYLALFQVEPAPTGVSSTLAAFPIPSTQYEQHPRAVWDWPSNISRIHLRVASLSFCCEAEW